MSRYGVYVHDPEGDMGYGVIVGGFATAAKAEDKAEAIRTADSYLECIVLPIRPSATSTRRIVKEVQE